MERIYDERDKHCGYMKDNTIYDKHHNVMGYIEEPMILDANYNPIAYINNDIIYTAYGPIGYFDEWTVRDMYGNKLGRVNSTFGGLLGAAGLLLLLGAFTPWGWGGYRYGYGYPGFGYPGYGYGFGYPGYGLGFGYGPGIGFGGFFI